MKNQKPYFQKSELIIIIVLLTSARLYGSTFSGTVLDSKTNLPIPGVRVSIGFTDTVTYTNVNGYFSFSHILSAKEKHSLKKAESVRLKKELHHSSIYLYNCPSINRIKVFNVNGRCIYSSGVSKSQKVLQLPRISDGMYVVQLLGENSVRHVLKWNSMNAAQFENFLTYNKKARSAELSGSHQVILQNDFYYPLQINESSSPQTILMKPDPRSAVFDESKISRYDFILTKADSLSMEQNALAEEYIPAEFSFNNVPFGKVGLRYKGSSYSLPNCFEDDGTRKDKPECSKISFKIKFNEYTDSLRFYKMKRLNLHSESADLSKMHDILSYALFREMGITAPRCAFAQVFLNGVFQGLFCAVEDIDGRFTEARWPDDGDGNLYKEKWPISGSPLYYKDGLVTNDKPEDSADVSKMVQFYNAVENSDQGTFKSQVSPFIDFDYWLHYIAVDRVIHNSDGIMTWYAQSNWTGNHNYYFYEPKEAGERLWIIPWDLHVTFSRKDQIVDVLGAPEWNVKPPTCDTITLWGNQAGFPANCDRLTGLTADVFWNEFVKISEKMLKTCFDTKYLQGKIDKHIRLIDTVIQKDPHVDYETWQGQVNSLRSDIAALNSDFDDYIHNRSVVNDTGSYLQPFDGNGYLSINQLNNFEFQPIGNENEWATRMISKNSTITVVHDTVNPLWGKADVFYSFVYNTAPGEGKYLEWGRTTLDFEKPVDLTFLKEIQVNLKSDSNRELWMYIASPEYSRNNLSFEYGWWDGTAPKDSLRVFKINAIGYPSWATGNPPEILHEVLSKATGIGFSSNPHFNADGELYSTPDSGFLRIDNVRFVF